MVYHIWYNNVAQLIVCAYFYQTEGFVVSSDGVGDNVTGCGGLGVTG